MKYLILLVIFGMIISLSFISAQQNTNHPIPIFLKQSDSQKIFFETINVSKPAKTEIQGTCKKDSKETNEGPGGDYCTFNTYEECYDYSVKSTVIAYNCDIIPIVKCYENERGTDYCSSSTILNEAYLNCGLSVLLTDEVKWKEKDCTDYNFVDNWEYYCTSQQVMKRRTVANYGCNNGACKVSDSHWDSQIISEKDDIDYCSLRKGYGCSLCGYEDSDCDFDSECSSGLKCVGHFLDIISNDYDGCCNSGEEWYPNLKKCVEKKITCSKNSDCGTDQYVGSLKCDNNDVALLYRTYKCDNPGTYQFDCSYSGSYIKQQECGDNGCDGGKCRECSKNSDCGTDGSIGNLYCSNENVWQKYRTYICNNPGTDTTSCINSDKGKEITSCHYGCENGKCKSQPQITCSKNSDCGTDSWTGITFCLNNNVYQKYKIYTCSNPGTVSSLCLNSDSDKLKQDCQYGCENGICKTNSGTITCSKNSDCGADSWTGTASCSENNLIQNYITYTCSNSGTTSSICGSSSSSKVKEICSYGCEINKCKSNSETGKPDLTVSDLRVQSKSGKDVVLGFTIKNIGTSTANNIYWTIYPGNNLPQIKRTTSVSLAPGNYTRAYMKLTYLSSGSYNPKVVVDFDNLVAESKENNNQQSISITV